MGGRAGGEKREEGDLQFQDGCYAAARPHSGRAEVLRETRALVIGIKGAVSRFLRAAVDDPHGCLAPELYMITATR